MLQEILAASHHSRPRDGILQRLCRARDGEDQPIDVTYTLEYRSVRLAEAVGFKTRLPDLKLTLGMSTPP